MTRVRIVTLAMFVACGDGSQTSSDAGDATICTPCHEAGLCDPNEPPIPAQGCPTGQFVCWEGDPGINGCTVNPFCASAPAGFPAPCFECKPPAPDAGCGAGEVVCSYALSRVHCANNSFCAAPQSELVCSSSDAGLDAPDATDSD